MPAGSGNVPWPVVLVIVVVVLVLLSGATALAIPLLLGGIGVWLVISSVQGLRGPLGRVTYWRGERLHLDQGTSGSHLVRSLFAIALGLGLIAFTGWYLFHR